MSKINELFTSSGPVDTDSVVATLKPLLQIQSETKEMFLTHEGMSLSVAHKVLIYGLAKKLMKIEELIESENFSATQVAKELTINKGSVDSSFNKLRHLGLIVGSGKNYTIPNSKVHSVNMVLLNEESTAHGK